MISKFKIKMLTDIFKSMTEWAMTNIMQQCSYSSIFCKCLVVVFRGLALNDFQEFFCEIVYSETMTKTGMSRARVYKIGKTQLLNAA